MADNFNRFLTDIVADRSIPEFVRDNYPTFEALLKAYYQWLEQSKQSVDIANHLRDYRDIDRTIDEFVEHFRKEYLINIPQDVLANKELLVKQIKNFYLNKGNEQSFRFLFRILYNETIEFYYPKKDILRASDGKWFEQTSIKILVTEDTNLPLFANRQVVGQTSGATGIVETILQYTDRGVSVAEFVLSAVHGEFIPHEDIAIQYQDEDGEVQTHIEELIELYTEIIVTEGGSSYKVDDRIPIRDEDGNEIGKAVVYQVSRGKVTGLNIIEPGVNYNGYQQQVTFFSALPINYTWHGIYLPDATIGAQSSNDVDFASMMINELIDPEIIEYGNGDFIQINDSPNSSGSGAFGVVTLIDDYGGILEVELLAGGDLYESPTAEVLSETGTGAEIDVIGGGGSIKKLKLENFPIVLNDDITSNGFTAYPDFTDLGDGNAEGTLDSGALAIYPGRWLNEDGHLSSNKKLQDNRYYQDYSYVIKAGVALNTWRDTIKKIIHPAGLEVFGEVAITNFKGSKLRKRSLRYERNIRLEPEAATAQKVDSMIKLYYVADGSPILDSNGDTLIDFE